MTIASELRDEARVLWDRAQALIAQSYDREADAYLLEGAPLYSDFYAALAACYRNEEGAQERKERAHAALRAQDRGSSSAVVAPSGG